jgi:hypothetical protein
MMKSLYSSSINVFGDAIKKNIDDELQNQEKLYLVEQVNHTENNGYHVSYISDIHLDHKVYAKFPKPCDRRRIYNYVNNIAKTLTDEYNESLSSLLLIVGDTSHSFAISEMFYECLRHHMDTQPIYVTLGNHELWDTDIMKNPTRKNDIIEIIHKYRVMLKKYNISLLHNDVAIIEHEVSGDSYYRYTKFPIVDILKLSDHEFRQSVSQSLCIILGSIGFSGNSIEYGAKAGIYRSVIPNIDIDHLLTQEFALLYNKVYDALKDRKVIVMTHMPLEFWSTSNHVNNWIYVSGHTHRNTYVDKESIRVFSDNQIGYIKNKPHLKQFYLDTSYNIFEYYNDGIYEITSENYKLFYLGQRSRISFNRLNCIIYMIKRKGIYCFILEKNETKKKFILDGGSIKTLHPQNDVSYYYVNIEVYADAISAFMTNYWKYINDISQLIKNLGGDGRIHGSIVDIDFFNHVFVNPFDGKLTPYYALSMVDKQVYKNLPSLLFCRKKLMYSKLIKNLEMTNRDLLPKVIGSDDLDIVKKSIYTPETDIYRTSKIATSMQYIKLLNIVRVWNDDFVLNAKDGKMSNPTFAQLIGDNLK